MGGEDRLLEKAKALALQISPACRWAIADHPAVAQVLSELQPGLISPEGEDVQSLRSLPIQALRHLEGLKAWPKIRQVEHIIMFFQNIGIHHIEQILFFDPPSFRERWGELGLSIWKRLHGREDQSLSPLIPDLPLTTYAYFDDPLSLLPLLMPRISQSLRLLFLRIEARGRFAKSIGLRLHCEYSDHQHFLMVEPVSPSRDQNLFEGLIEKKLSELDLENPIREFEIEISDVPEKIQQMDFFAPRDLSEDRWKRLISFARQAQIEVGFLEVQPKHFPEESFELKSDWPAVFSQDDIVERIEEAIQVKSVYAKGLLKAPRPSLLLEEPLPLTAEQFGQYRKLSFFPLERIDASWWARLKPNADERKTHWGKYRDYYFALSEEGQLVWIYQDRETKDFYLHGYFD